VYCYISRSIARGLVSTVSLVVPPSSASVACNPVLLFLLSLFFFALYF
jgi:catabolite regulation protein CreA